MRKILWRNLIIEDEVMDNRKYPKDIWWIFEFIPFAVGEEIIYATLTDLFYYGVPFDQSKDYLA